MISSNKIQFYLNFLKMSRKLKADKIAKKYVQSQKVRDEDNLSESYSYSEEESKQTAIPYNPSKLIKTEQESPEKLKKITLNNEKYEDHANLSDNDYDIGNEEESNVDVSESDMMMTDDNEEIFDQLDDLEKEENDVDLIGELVKSKEKDKAIAQEIRNLQDQRKELYKLFIHIHSLLPKINKIPPKSLDDDTDISPYNISLTDKEVQKAYEETASTISMIESELNGIYTALSEKYFNDMTKEDRGDTNLTNDFMFDRRLRVISKLDQRRIGQGSVKGGNIINRTIYQQLQDDFNDIENIKQPTRRLADKLIGIGEDYKVDYLRENYNDKTLFDHMNRWIIEDASKGKMKHVSKKTHSSAPTKKMLRSRQISYEIIPELQNYIAPTREPIPDSIDALIRSLMSS